MAGASRGYPAEDEIETTEKKDLNDTVELLDDEVEPIFTTPSRLIAEECPSFCAPIEKVDEPNDMSVFKEVNYTVESLEERLAR